MTSLNSKLQLALINRKKGRNLLEKGFTLVELMIVIVIVGVLSAVALPNFLGQQNKAKITEASSKMGAILKSSYAEYIYDNSEDNAFVGAKDASTDASTGGKFDYAPDGADAAAATATDTTTNQTTLYLIATPKAEADGGDKALVAAQGTDKGIYACVNLDTGKLAVGREFRADRNAAIASDVDCS